MSENEKKGKIKKIIITIIVVLVVIGLLILLFPLIFFGEIFVEMFFNKPDKPQITHGEFPFELVYEYNNEQITIKGTIVCDYEGISFALEGGNRRDWACVIQNNDNYGRYFPDEENFPELYIQVPLEAEYYMGASDANSEIAKPYIYYADETTGTMYYEQDLSEVVGVKIVSWEPSEPIKNIYK